MTYNLHGSKHKTNEIESNIIIRLVINNTSLYFSHDLRFDHLEN